MKRTPWADTEAFLTRLYREESDRHGLIFASPPPPKPEIGTCYSVSELPLEVWHDWIVRWYETRVAWHEALGDDAVPCAHMGSNTGIHANAFGAPIHTFPGQDTLPCALPFVRTAEEADALPEATLDTPVFGRIFRLAEMLTRTLGPEAWIGVPDMQSPFDIAALIWNKEDMFVAMLEEPDAVKRLVAKCDRFLRAFYTEYRRLVPRLNVAHCPYCWAPPELGIWMSEDEAGAISCQMFEEFCLPWLVGLARDFSGINLHCCADADHQYVHLAKLPEFRAFNRCFTRDPQATVEAFSGRTVIVTGWQGEAQVERLLAIARPETRYLFCQYPGTLDEAKRQMERLALS